MINRLIVRQSAYDIREALYDDEGYFQSDCTRIEETVARFSCFTLVMLCDIADYLQEITGALENMKKALLTPDSKVESKKDLDPKQHQEKPATETGRKEVATDGR